MQSLLNDYLSKHFITLEELAKRCHMQPLMLQHLIREHLVMAPSYIVSGGKQIESHVFGSMACDGAADGLYFHPASIVWVARATTVLREYGESAAYETLQAMFEEGFSQALASLDKSVWRLRDCFTDDATVIASALQERLRSAWHHHLHGTFGLCVANPVSEAAIARKEILQEKLSSLSDNGEREVFTQLEAQRLLEVIDEYASCAMPFSPVEYPISSRFRLVEKLRPRVQKNAGMLDEIIPHHEP